MKSLTARKHPLSNPLIQLNVIQNPGVNGASGAIQPFREKLKALGKYPLQPGTIDTLQINLGYMCNQTCTHCHVDAGPDRKEIMTRETMQYCLKAMDHPAIKTIDLTGGAPELNPDFQWFVPNIKALDKHVIVRSNLTILVSNSKFRTYVDFFARHGLEVISSLPCYTAENTDKQRGDGVFRRSIEALKLLNRAGYGKEGTGLQLHLVYNPGGAFLPPDQKKLEADYKLKLKEDYGIDFNNLYCITNMPISRFLDYLMQTGQYGKYMHLLVNAFNPAAVDNLMCRNLLSIGWDGYLYDCDFNQMLAMRLSEHAPMHIKDFDYDKLSAREIVIGNHCYGCTAGAGSSCGGVLTSA